MATIALVDAIRNGVPAPTGVTKDDTCAEPPLYEPNRLYAWMDTEERVETGDGSIDDSRFVLWLALTLTARQQLRASPKRATATALDVGVDAIAGWVKSNRADSAEPPKWEDLQVRRINYSRPRGLEFRAHLMEIAGYRHITI